MNAVWWFNAQSFSQHEPKAPSKPEEPKPDHVYDRWDEAGKCWRTYEQWGDVIKEVTL